MGIGRNATPTRFHRPFRYLARSKYGCRILQERYLLCAIVALSGTGLSAAEPDARPQFGGWGVDLSSLDKNVRPGDNFFEYVNGSWLKRATIPADRSSTGAFDDLQILSEQRLRSIVGELQPGHTRR